MRSLSISVRRLVSLSAAVALVAAALAVPAGAMPYDSAHKSAGVRGPHSYAVSASSIASNPSPAGTETGSGGSTPWAEIGFGVAGMLLLIAGTTVLVRRHDRTRHYAAPSV